MRLVRQLINSDPSKNLEIANPPSDLILTDQEATPESILHFSQLEDTADLADDSSLTDQEDIPDSHLSHFSQLDDATKTPIIMQKLEQSEPSLNPNYEIIHPSLNPIDPSESPTERTHHSHLNGLFAIVDQMRQANTPEELFETTVAQVRQCLQADRVLIYHFENESQGTVVAESIVNGYTPSLKAFLPAIAFGAKQPQDYHNQPFIVLDEVAQDTLTPHQLQLLERFQVKASLSLPIWVEGQLWGLLVTQRCADSRRWQEFELNRLHQIVGELRLYLQPVVARAQKQKQTEQDQVIAKVIIKIHQSQDVAGVFQTTTHEVRRQLKCDRVAVYRFNPDWTGQFVSESVGENWIALVGLELETAWSDSHLQETQGGRYRNHESIAVNDIYSAGHSPCDIEILEGFEVKAYTIAPIFDGETLWGLLAAYQNSGSRRWEPTDVNLLVRVGQQFGLALRQAEYLEQVRSQSIQLNQEIERGQAITNVLNKLRQPLEFDVIFKTIAQEIRRLLNVERLTVYKFRPDFFGDFVAESAAKGLPQLVGSGWEDPYVQEHQGGRFRDNEPLVVHDIYNAGTTDCHVETLEGFGVKACLVVSIFQGQKLWGLLSAFQNSAPRHWEEEDVQLMMRLATPFGFSLQQAEYVEQLQNQAKQLQRAVEQQQFIAKVVEQIGQTFDLQTTFKATAREIRSFLEVDRVALFKFHPGSRYTTGETVVENVKPGYVSALSTRIEDHCFSEGFAEHYKKGRVCAIDDIYNAGLADCYIEVLAQFQVQADLVVGVIQGEELWGLFCIHQCSRPRHWQETEIEFVRQVAAQLSIAIQQGDYAQQLQVQSQQMAESAQQEKSAKEQLQQEVIQLLMSVRPALEGDLTVRAPVTDTEVGTVADAYNNTLGSLRQIVTQMQTAANQVTQTTQSSSTSIATLTTQAQVQLQSIDQALQRVQTMVYSTEAVEINAQQVEAAVQQTNQTILAGDAAIDRTVEEMEDIRETVVETSKRLQRLSESSQKISRVVSLIGNFTTQTQLLALNASIEATRAGEFGRGFGVVADEVRSLARQSATAATEIEQLVQEIQAGTAEVSSAMEMGIHQVESGTTVVQEARQNLNEIVSATAEISQLVTGITQATQAQTQQCQSVTQTMTEVATIAHKTLEDSVTISASFENLLATAQDLQSKSEQFKVN